MTFIRTKAAFKVEHEIDFEALGISHSGVEEGDFCFDINDLTAFNESDDSNTTLWFKSGEIIMVYIKYSRFLQYMEDKIIRL